MDLKVVAMMKVTLSKYEEEVTDCSRKMRIYFTVTKNDRYAGFGIEIRYINYHGVECVDITFAKALYSPIVTNLDNENDWYWKIKYELCNEYEHGYVELKLIEAKMTIELSDSEIESLLERIANILKRIEIPST